MALKDDVAAINAELVTLKTEAAETAVVAADQSAKIAELAAQIEVLTGSIPSAEDLAALQNVAVELKAVSASLDALQPKPPTE